MASQSQWIPLQSMSASGAEGYDTAFHDLRKAQEEIPLNVANRRLPKETDFRNEFPIRILETTIDEEIQHCVILLHDRQDTETSLLDLAKRLRKSLPESAFLLIRVQGTLLPENPDDNSADSNVEIESELFESAGLVLKNVVKRVLIRECSFQPQNIIFIGHCYGGQVALASTAAWNATEFGGVVSIGGPMPPIAQLKPLVKSKTPALILGNTEGKMVPATLSRIRNTYVYMDDQTSPTASDDIPNRNGMGPILDFLAHRLRREEWNKQAIISFDGGGIRGYGSLLILKELMNKIGSEEQNSGDGETESSFSPCDFRPRRKGGNAMSPLYENYPLGSDDIVVSSCTGLSNSSKFYPCHYFTYSAGTSTGGLISIMLHRFRMTVDDCIKEYENFGDKVFGYPRPHGGMKGLFWHKYDYRALESVIKDVTIRHGKQSQNETVFSMGGTVDDDMCKCMVIAYDDQSELDRPYLFRTYRTPRPSTAQQEREERQDYRKYGEPSALPIWQVARATSAAPTYFPPLMIETENGSRRFKDGGFGSNNPSTEIYRDVFYTHGENIEMMGPFVSIGAGITIMDKFGSREGNVRNAIATFKSVFKAASRTQNVHDQMVHTAGTTANWNFPYYRFDGGKGLGEIKLDEWKSHKFARLKGKDRMRGCKTLKKIREHVEAYVNEPDVQDRLDECARILVRRRRLRTRDPSSWDRYASFSSYECERIHPGCPETKTNASAFQEHLRKFHGAQLSDNTMEERLKQCRRYHWVYRDDTAT